MKLFELHAVPAGNDEILYQLIPSQELADKLQEDVWLNELSSKVEYALIDTLIRHDKGEDIKERDSTKALLLYIEVYKNIKNEIQCAVGTRDYMDYMFDALNEKTKRRALKAFDSMLKEVTQITGDFVTEVEKLYSIYND